MGKKRTSVKRVVTTVTIRHEGLPVRELRRLALSCVGRNSVGGAGGHGWYSAKTTSVKLLPEEGET